MNKTKIASLLLLGIASLLVASHFWTDAFPIATVDFRISRSEAQEQLGKFLEAQGDRLDGYHRACRFDERASTKRFLELEYGVSELENLTRKGLNIWHWSGRWFKPETREEFSAGMDTRGNLVAYCRTIKEETALPFLEKEAAQVLAGEFLRKNLKQHSWDQLRFISGSVDRKPHRTDYSFVWEREDLHLRDAPYRVTVTVQGNEIGGYSEFLKIPEAWTRNYDEKRDVNELCTAIAGVPTLGILVASFVLLIVYITRRQVRWKTAIPWGWLVVLGIVTLASGLNDLPQSFFNYSTTQNWPSFLAQSAFEILRRTLGWVLGYWLLLLVADAIYRERLPQHPSFHRAFGLFALRDPRTLQALGVGIVFALFGLAYVSVFYVVGRKFGVWCPVDIDNAKALSGLCPWIEPMQVGLSAAFGEEMLFRVIGIILFWKLLRVRWLAVVLAAATWGFLHSTYPQMPGYIRGIELTAEGILWGVLMFRFGIVSTLTSHYLYNCWLGSWIVFQSPSWTNKIAALIVSLWPVALFVWGWWKKADMPEPEVHSAPAASVPPPLVNNTVWDFSPVQLTGRQRAGIAFFCVVALVATVTIHRPQDKYAAFGRVGLSRDQIALKADAVLSEHGFTPSDYRRIITLSSTSLPSKYLLEHGSLDQLAGLFQTEWPNLDLKWGIRYFKILQREEFSLELDKDGNLTHWNHTVLPEAPGASLDRDTALAKVTDCLAQKHGIVAARETLVTETPVKQEHRLDYAFTFERTNWNWGDARLRTDLKLQGDEPVSFSRYIKVPEAWNLKQAKSGWKKFAANELGRWVSIVEGIIFAVLFVLLLRRNIIPWRTGFVIAVFPTLIVLLDRWNHLPEFFSGYLTTSPLNSYLIKQWGFATTSLAMAYLGKVLMICVTLGFLRWSFGWTVGRIAVWPTSRQERGRFLLDCFLIVAGSIFAFSALSFLLGAIEGAWFPSRVASFSHPKVNVIFPWLNALTMAIGDAFDSTLKIGLLASVGFLIYRKYPKTICGFVVLYPVLAAMKSPALPEFFFNLLSAELLLGLSLFLILRFWRFNPALVFFFYAISSLVNFAVGFIEKGGRAYQWQALPELLVLALLGIYLVIWFRRSSRQAQSFGL